MSRQRDARLTHAPRYSRIGPSLRFAIIAAPNRSTKNVNTTKSRHLHDMRPSPFPHAIRIDVTSSDALVTICGIHAEPLINDRSPPPRTHHQHHCDDCDESQRLHFVPTPHGGHHLLPSKCRLERWFLVGLATRSAREQSPHLHPHPSRKPSRRSSCADAMEGACKPVATVKPASPASNGAR